MSYMKIIIPSMYIMFLTLTLAFIQRTNGNNKMLLITSILSLGVNISLNYYFVVVLQLNIMAIAIASLFSYIVQLIYII